MIEFYQKTGKLRQNLCPLYRKCPLYGMSVLEIFHCTVLSGLKIRLQSLLTSILTSALRHKGKFAIDTNYV